MHAKSICNQRIEPKDVITKSGRSKEDEKMSYSFEDLILCNVLTLLHPKLPAFVEKKFHDKIRDNKRLMDYKDEILEQAKEMIEEIETPQLSAINFEVQQQQQQPG